MKITGTIEFDYEYENVNLMHPSDDPKEDPRPDEEDETVNPQTQNGEEGEIKEKGK
ncbi:hypothetical protein [uncultured Dokdonia sp.]|uniref:hypothetical protein n=1 Tax=uncultured Dokdonia sp. TaxID=575653 RepID=UPI002615B99B|nr:hypothetical protein [uncultured Dokdonia sp.]